MRIPLDRAIRDNIKFLSLGSPSRARGNMRQEICAKSAAKSACELTAPGPLHSISYPRYLVRSPFTLFYHKHSTFSPRSVHPQSNRLPASIKELPLNRPPFTLEIPHKGAVVKMPSATGQNWEKYKKEFADDEEPEKKITPLTDEYVATMVCQQLQDR